MVESRLSVEERLEAIEDALELLLGADPPAAICNEPAPVTRTPIYDGEAAAKTPLPGGIRVLLEGIAPHSEGYVTDRQEVGVHMDIDQKLNKIVAALENIEGRLTALETRASTPVASPVVDKVVGTMTVLASSFLEGAIRGAGGYAGQRLAALAEAQIAPPPPPPAPSLWAVGAGVVAATAATAAVTEVTKIGVRGLFDS